MQSKNTSPKNASESPSAVLKSFTQSLKRPVKLLEALRCSFPACPPMKSDNTAEGTRGPSKKELRYPANKQLRSTVYLPTLLDDFKSGVEAWANRVETDQNVDSVVWMSQIHPGFPTLGLPLPVNSEQDSTQWIEGCLLQPCQWLLQAYRGVRFSGLYGLSEDVISLTSAPVHECMPDKVLARLTSRTEQDVVLTLEFKTHNAMPRSLFAVLCDNRNNIPHQNVARPFCWPAEGRTAAGTTEATKLMKMLVQVWSQMVHYNVNHAILTSYESTIFFMRSESHPGTLYHSPVLEISTSPDLLIVITGFLEHALGLSKVKVNLPEPCREWWTPEMKDGQTPNLPLVGVDLESEFSWLVDSTSESSRSEEKTPADSRSEEDTPEDSTSEEEEEEEEEGSAWEDSTPDNSTSVNRQYFTRSQAARP